MRKHISLSRRLNIIAKRYFLRPRNDTKMVGFATKPTIFVSEMFEFVAERLRNDSFFSLPFSFYSEAHRSLAPRVVSSFSRTALTSPSESASVRVRSSERSVSEKATLFFPASMPLPR